MRSVTAVCFAYGNKRMAKSLLFWDVAQCIIVVLATFRDSLSVPYSRVDWLVFEDGTAYQSHILGWTGWSSKMGQPFGPIFEGGLVDLSRWDSLSVPYSRVDWLIFEDGTACQSHILGWTGWPFKMGQPFSPIFECGLVELSRWDSLSVPYSRVDWLIFEYGTAYQSHILGWTGWPLKMGQPFSPIF